MARRGIFRIKFQSNFYSNFFIGTMLAFPLQCHFSFSLCLFLTSSSLNDGQPCPRLSSLNSSNVLPLGAMNRGFPKGKKERKRERKEGMKRGRNEEAVQWRIIRSAVKWALMKLSVLKKRRCHIEGTKMLGKEYGLQEYLHAFRKESFNRMVRMRCTCHRVVICRFFCLINVR